MVICTLANNIIIPNMKQNGQTHCWNMNISRFVRFKPRPLIHMHDIITKNNRAHLWTMGYLCTKYDMNPMYRSGDFVFTSSTWQNHIKPRLLCILMIFNVFIRWSSGHYQTTLSCQIWNKTDKRWLKYEHFKIFTLSPAHSLICANIITKNNRAHLRAMGYLCTKYDMNPMYGSWDIVFTSLPSHTYIHTFIHTYIHPYTHTYTHTPSWPHRFLMLSHRNQKMIFWVFISIFNVSIDFFSDTKLRNISNNNNIT